MRRDEPSFIADILASDWLWLVARIVLSFMFWITGIQWILNFSSATGAAGSVGLSPPGFWGAVLIAFYLLGSLAIILDRWMWLATGAFGVFIVLTLVLVHRFWTQPPEQAAKTWLEVKEHITVIGGLMSVAIASYFRRRALAGDGRY